jgi:hypothetical protein
MPYKILTKRELKYIFKKTQIRRVQNKKSCKNVLAAF